MMEERTITAKTLIDIDDRYIVKLLILLGVLLNVGVHTLLWNGGTRLQKSESKSIFHDSNMKRIDVVDFE